MSEIDALCDAITKLAKTATAAGITHVAVTLPILGQVALTLAPQAPAVAPVARPGPGPAAAGQRRGPASRLADFHAKQQQHKHDVLFAASSVKPKFTQPEPPPATVPRAERDRRAAARGNEEADG